MTLRPLRLGLGLLVTVAACASPPDDSAPARLVSGVTFDGLVVLEEIGPRERVLSIFDPNTGKSSPSHVAVHRAISPDGRHLAWCDAAGTVFIARPALVDGAPDLEVLHQLAVGPSPLRWVDDTALFTDFSRVDAITGEVRTCQTPDTQAPLPIHPVLGTDDHLCVVDGHTLHRYVDGAFAGSLQGSGPLSPDGQFLYHWLHLPTGVTVAGGADNLDQERAHARFPLADGRELLLPEGGHGELVEVGFSGLETVFKRLYVDAMPLDGRALDYAQIFTAGIIDHDGTRWDLEKALRPYFNQGTGRRYAPIFVRADGSAAIYAVVSHVVETRFVGEDVGQEPSLVEVFVASALVEVRPDRTTRGFLTSETPHDAVVLGHDGLDDLGRAYGASLRTVDFGDGDWLVTGYRRDPLGVLREAMWGYLDGRPTAIDGHATTTAGAPSILSPDGRWLIGVGDPATVGDVQPVCLRDLTGGPARCVAPGRAGYPIGVLGQGLHAAFADAPPLVLGLSRLAAPVGAVVDVYGARFGASGTLSVGALKVPPAAILAWSPHRIRLRVDASWPTTGAVVVTTAQGTSSGRALHLGRAPTPAPPFSGVPDGPFALGQGVNLVDLGDLGAPGGTETFVGNANAATVRVTPETRLPDGRFALLSTGGTGEHHTVTVHAGPFSRILDFILEDRLADEDRWQLVLPQGLNAEHRNGFMTLAGDLIERSHGVHPTLDGRFELTSLPNRNLLSGATGQEIPEYFRTDGDATYVSLGYHHVQLVHHGWPMRRLLGYTAPNGAWGVAQYAAAPSITPPFYQRHFAVAGDTLLVVGADPLTGDPNAERGGPHYALSHDGGVTLGPGVWLAPDVLPATSVFAEPMTVRAAAGTFFLVFETPLSDVDLLGVHAISLTGALEANVTEVPPDITMNPFLREFYPVTQATDGGRVLLHSALDHTLVFIDFDAPAPAWEVVPSASDAGQMRTFHHDPATGEIIALRLDGTVAVATRAGGWRDWTAVDLGLNFGGLGGLDLPVTVVPMSLAKLPGGRWVMLARWLSPAAAEPGEPSVFGPSGWLVGPR